MERFYSPKEAAELLNVPEWTVMEAIRQQKLPVLEFSRKTRRIAESQLKRWMEQCGYVVAETGVAQ